MHASEEKNAEQSGSHVKGVKFNSPFNTIPLFHVTTPSLPPCIEHDLHEGVVSHDLMRCLGYFCEIKKMDNTGQIK